MSFQKVFYEVETLRAGQPRPYADTENEYLIKVTRTIDWGPRKGTVEPWLVGGDIEKRIQQEEAARQAGTMLGGQQPDEMRKYQRQWARNVVDALCEKSREIGDKDGMIEGTAESFFYSTLKKLTLDAKAGTIRALIIHPYTD